MKKHIVTIFLILSLPACAVADFLFDHGPSSNPLPYLAAIESWEGHPIAELLAAWRKPSSIEILDNGIKHYNWVHSEAVKKDGCVEGFYYDEDNELRIRNCDDYYISCVTEVSVFSDDPEGLIFAVITSNLYNCEEIARMTSPPPRAPDDKAPETTTPEATSETK
jgi:hypothetical protein